MKDNDDGRNQVQQRTSNPHKRSPGDLIIRSGERQDPWSIGIVRIENAATEGKERRYSRIHEIGGEEIRNDRPARPHRTRWPGLNDGPPEKERGKEETGVLDFVPRFGPVREFVGHRNVALFVLKRKI